MRPIRWTRRNMCLIPWVVLRVMVLGPLMLLSSIGEKAHTLGLWLSFKIPGFED